MDLPLGGWLASASAWMESQGELGDQSRQEILDPCLDQILGQVEGLAILDVGCGEGRYAAMLASKGATVTGIDPVGVFIKRASSRCPTGTFVQGFAEAVPFESQSFDLVLSYLSIIDIPDYVKAISEMARVVRPKGRVILVTVSNMASATDGWVKDEAGIKLYRSIDRYMDEFALDLSWNGIRIANYHRPLSAILKAFFDTGLKMTGFYEPLPQPDSPCYQDEFRVPTFQVMQFEHS